MVQPLSIDATELRLGIYQHYSGKKYEVLGVGHHTETEEELVLYRSHYVPVTFWARPLKMFIEKVMIDGKEMPRFTYLSE